ncbi:hypothetical protein MTP99_012376 [Tenebrio molitor]|nr:hypothetical protein MTP99_012376 [Tenebrio molitor]
MGKPLKKPTPGQAAAGLEPGTSRVQSGALGAWPRFSVNSGQRCVPVLFGVLCPLFGRPMSGQSSQNKIGTLVGGLRSCSVWFQLSDNSNSITFVHGLNVLVLFTLPSIKRLLCKSALDKKTMIFFETTSISRGGTQPALSRVTPA